MKRQAAIALLFVVAMIGLWARSGGNGVLGESAHPIRRHMEESGIVFPDANRPPPAMPFGSETAIRLAYERSTTQIGSFAGARAYAVYHRPGGSLSPRIEAAWLVHFWGVAIPIHTYDGQILIHTHAAVLLTASGDFIHTTFMWPNSLWEEPGDPFGIGG